MKHHCPSCRPLLAASAQPSKRTRGTTFVESVFILSGCLTLAFGGHRLLRIGLSDTLLKESACIGSNDCAGLPGTVASEVANKPSHLQSRDIVAGVGEGLAKAAGEIASLVAHPIDTATGLADFATLTGKAAAGDAEAMRTLGSVVATASSEIKQAFRDNPDRALGLTLAQLATMPRLPLKGAQLTKLAKEISAAGRELTYLDKGVFSTVWRDGDSVIKEIRTKPGIGGKLDELQRAKLAEDMIHYTNQLAETMPEVIPMTSAGPGLMRQPFVDGKKLNELSESARAFGKDEMSRVVKKAATELELAKFTDSAVLKDGSLLQVDWIQPNNFRFTDDGHIIGWFDAVTIRPSVLVHH